MKIKYPCLQPDATESEKESLLAKIEKDTMFLLAQGIFENDALPDEDVPFD